LPELGSKTPLEAAHTPNMDRAAREGILGMARHIPPGMAAGSDIGMMSVVGYDPLESYTGRAPLEAADLDITLRPHEWAVRCNLVTVRDRRLIDFAAGHISNEEARTLLQALNEELGSDAITFHVGVSYRHVMTYAGEESLDFGMPPPHDVTGLALAEVLPHCVEARVLLELMERSCAVLQGHPVNCSRAERGLNSADMIWLWGQGTRPHLARFEDRFGVSGAVISAVNLVRGIGRLIGWEVIRVPGATGYLDTDYAAKGRSALEALAARDLVCVHVEAPDEASHERDAQAKIAAIEAIDLHVVGPAMARADECGDMRLLITPDHVTRVENGRHEIGPVPFAMWGAGVQAAGGMPYCEALADATGVDMARGHELMSQFIERRA
jgi:2,3-bisphosphoglycerate-independent phosphoglycerate mutase